MNAAVAFYLADEAWTGSGGRPPQRPRRPGRRTPRRWRSFLVGAAAAAILFGTLGSDALGDPSGSGATAGPADDRSADLATAKKKRSAGKAAAKKRGHSKPGAKKRSAGKPGAKKRSAGKPGAKKRGRGRRRGRKRQPDPQPDLINSYYTAEVQGTAKYELTDSYGGSESRSASLRATRASVRLSRDEIVNPTSGQTVYFYNVDVSGTGEVMDASGTMSSVPNGSCSVRTVSDTELGPSPIRFGVGASLGLPGNRVASISGSRLVSSRVSRTDSGQTCTLPGGGSIQAIAPSTMTTEGVVGIPLNCNSAPSGLEVTSVATGDVVWGRPSTISVNCTETWNATGSVRGSTRTEISLTMALTPCPGRGTRACQ
jgi:hypothetical protein